MCILKKIRKKRLQKNLENLQSDMGKLNNQLMDKNESETASYLISHPMGNTCDLLNNGHNPEVLYHFWKLGFLNTTSDLKKADKNGTYRVTNLGRRQLKVEAARQIEPALDTIINILNGGD